MCICFGYKWLGEKQTHVVAINDFPEFKKDRTNDKYVVMSARDILEKAPVWVGWYSRKFDIPFINSRLVYHGRPTVPVRSASQHIDGWYTAKYQMRLHSNRLASVSDFLELRRKTPVTAKMWNRAKAGYEDGIQYVVDHCKADLKVTEDAYLKIRPLIVNHPNMALIFGKPDVCPRCGIRGHIGHRGQRFAAMHRYDYYFCSACNGWSRGPNEKLGDRPRLSC